MKESATTLGIAAVAAAAASFILSPAVGVSVFLLPFLYSGGKLVADVIKKSSKSSVTTTPQISLSDLDRNKKGTKSRKGGKSKHSEASAQEESKQDEKEKTEKQVKKVETTHPKTENEEEKKNVKTVGKASSHSVAAALGVSEPAAPSSTPSPHANQLSKEEQIKQQIDEKWAEVLDFAKQHATKQGMKTGIKWLEDSFNEYLALSDATPGYGMGGQPGSKHNREVLAERICLKLGNHAGGDHTITDEQEARLKESLTSIVANNDKKNICRIIR